VYFHWPNKEWQLLGYLANDKPSAVFKVSSNVNGFNDNQPEPATLGISIEPSDQVLQQVQSLKETGHKLLLGGPSSDSHIRHIAQKLVSHLYNYLSSFATNNPQGQVWGFQSQPLSDNQYVPMKSLLQWYGVIQSKIKNDPLFMERD
jgi:hypothetical protein